MKNLLLIASLITLCMACKGAADTNQTNWQLVSQGTVTPPKLNVMAPGVERAGFTNKQNGIALCEPPSVFYTTDSGRNWKRAKLPLTSAGLFSLEILNNGMAISHGGNHLRISHDFGKTWEELPDYGPLYMPGAGLSFINKSTGWYARNNLLASTQDGGQTWKTIQIPQNAASKIIAIHLTTEQLGFLLSSDGAVYKTTDSGKTWTSINLPLKNRRLLNYRAEAVGANGAIRFQNEQRGTVIIHIIKPRPGFIIFQTYNGGANWKEEQFPNNSNIKFGTIFLSRDGRYLTINDIINNRIVLLRYGK